MEFKKTKKKKTCCEMFQTSPLPNDIIIMLSLLSAFTNIKHIRIHIILNKKKNSFLYEAHITRQDRKKRFQKQNKKFKINRQNKR